MPTHRFTSFKDFMDWNEEMAHRYDPDAYHERSFIVISWIEKMRVSNILSVLRPTSHDRVLEVGCGAGNILQKVDSDHKFGIDLSSFLIEKSKIRLGESASLTKADAGQLPFCKSSFDKLICSEVLEHVEDPRGVLLQLARVANVGAVIVVSIPNEKMIEMIKSILSKMRLFSLINQSPGGYSAPSKMTEEWHLHKFDLDLLRTLAEGIFQIGEIRAIPSSFIPIRYVVQLLRE